MSRTDFDSGFFPFTGVVYGGNVVGPQGGVSPAAEPIGTFAVGVQRSTSHSSIVQQERPLNAGGGVQRRSSTAWDVFFRVDPAVKSGYTLVVTDTGKRYNILGPAADGGDGIFNLWLVECEEIR